MEEKERLFARFLHVLALAAGWLLLGLMVYTVIDVVLRYGFNAPFRSSLEFTQFCMAVIVFLGIAYCGWAGGHIAVDILERQLERQGWRWVPALLTLISAALFAAIAWYSLLDGLATMHRVSNMLRWPHYPFIFVTAAGSLLYAVVLLIQAIRSLGRKP